MKHFALVLGMLPLLAAADDIWKCAAPDGGQVFQDHPCNAGQPLQPGVIVIPHATLTPMAQTPPPVSAANCSIYIRDWRMANAQDRATLSNRIGARWSDRMRYDERYLRMHNCPLPG